ncbi:aminopeptidase [Aeropyrum pernix K1]|uniref:Aminopeptidase n=1 Tax=Aeropyrum pernix (strain ATCC 700893 / DSM 11879 / JCM 9820 / NBRC 100138 / K1) TaxID=272557 RepID=Q9YA57_AERPE|nr:aminopeptidase [Aeropyrum pernix]BAA81092.2 aminopeptidase [Aeropyrum pernix K1]
MYRFVSKTGEAARLIVDYCISASRGDDVAVSFGLPAIDFARAVALEVLSRGAYPLLNLRDEYVAEAMYRLAPEELLDYISPIDMYMLEKVDASISIISPLHTKPLATADPGKVARRSRASRPLTELFMKRDGEGSLRWTVTAYPAPSLAQEAGMGLLEFEDFVVRALKLHEDDPVAAWKRQAEWQEKVAALLSKASELRVVSSGTDITFRVEGRIWINDDGKKNMPGGEVFTAPHEDGVEGVVTFDFPAVWRGLEVEGVRLEFRGGQVVKASASKGEEHLRRILETDEGAKRLGELAFGLNYDIQRHIKNILFDEKIGGTMHMALGAAYPSTGGRNQSAIHWDMVKDLRRESRVYADGDLIFENGRFIEDYL